MKKNESSVHSSVCSTDTTEEYYIKRDEFMRYIAFEVNPARLAAGLSEIREHEARECYRIIIDFQRKWNEPSSNAPADLPAVAGKVRRDVGPSESRNK